MYVFVKDSTSIGAGSNMLLLARGDVWPASDPLVRDHPELFTEHPPILRRSAPPVEQATAGPGERRGVRRAAD